MIFQKNNTDGNSSSGSTGLLTIVNYLRSLIEDSIQLEIFLTKKSLNSVLAVSRITMTKCRYSIFFAGFLRKFSHAAWQFKVLNSPLFS